MKCEGGGNCYNDLKDGDYFKQHLHENNKIVLPFVLFFDDFETGNPLGSKRGVHKMGALYLSLRCLHPSKLSKLKNIFLVSLFPSKLRDKHGNKLIFEELIEEISSLETNGLNINGKSVIFKLAGFLGDNLGLNSILGFVESFSANYYCRFCKTPKHIAQLMVKEDKSTMRNEENYSHDVASDNVTASGVKEECVFNRIPSFNCTENYFCDPMHDICEGVANYDMVKIIQYYIENKVFTLDKLNARVQKFKFYKICKSNKPPIISKNRLNNGDLFFSASEMHKLVTFFSVIVGDLIPANCEVWQLYIRLKNILNICSCKSLSSDLCEYLDVLIREHNSLYLRLFKETLKPKYHLLVHYSRIIRQTGPVSHNWAYRFESKHYQSKQYATSCRSRINLAKSIAIRHQLLIASVLHNAPSDDSYEIGPGTVVDGVYNCEWVARRGVKLAVGHIVFVRCEEDLPVFGKIQFILVNCKNEVSLKLSLLNTIAFDDHINAFMVDHDRNDNITVNVEQQMKPLMIHILDRQSYVVINNYEV